MFKITIEQENRNILLHCNDCVREDKFLICEDVSFIKFRINSNIEEEITGESTNRVFSYFNIKDIIAYYVEEVVED